MEPANNAREGTATTKWLKSTLLRVDTLGLFLCIGLFLAWPEIDLEISSLFYDAEQGGFFWKDSLAVIAVYKLTGVIGGIITLALLAALAGSFLLKNDRLVQNRRIFLFLFCSYLVGPGIVVHEVLKKNWERPRPRQVVEFGGQRNFEAPFAPTFQCEKCRSFVSGHASVGFAFFSIALLARRRRWFIGSLIAGGIIGSGRIIQGGHFFSDIVFCAWVVWFCTLLLHYLFFRREPPETQQLLKAT